ncbi:MAG: protein BatD, partial [Clostridiaceae bacterium]|nr:protein BatD [Clostridiaceae bacterium]
MIGKKNKAAFLFLIIITIFIGSTSKVIAKDPEFLLDIDTLNLQKGKSTNLMLTLKNAQGAKLSQINGLENFDVLSSNQSTSTQIINGDISYQTDIRYIIMPKSTGKFTLEGIVEYKGKAYQTNLLNINVSEAKDLPQEEVSDLFVKTIISDNEVYLGQKVILAYELYSRYNIE